jgi:hypothetical protein
VFTKLKTNLVVAAILGFLGSVPGSVKGYLNVQELLRVAVAAAVAGGGAWGAAAAIVADLPQIMTPQDLGLATSAVMLLVEVLRRLGHGAQADLIVPNSSKYPRSA